jgi:hypothetical protein
MWKLASIIILAAGPALAQPLNMNSDYFRDVARDNAARDAARAQEKQADTLRRMERNQRDRERRLDRQERNSRRDAR